MDSEEITNIAVRAQRTILGFDEDEQLDEVGSIDYTPATDGADYCVSLGYVEHCPRDMAADAAQTWNAAENSVYGVLANHFPAYSTVVTATLDIPDFCDDNNDGYCHGSFCWVFVGSDAAARADALATKLAAEHELQEIENAIRSLRHRFNKAALLDKRNAAAVLTAVDQMRDLGREVMQRARAA